VADAPTIAIINGTPRHVDDALLAGMVPDFQTWVDDHLGPAWNVGARLVFAPRVRDADPNYWWVVINTHSDEPGALGYHAQQPNGLPYARIFVDDDRQAGVSLSVTISHELAEMIVNPTIDKMVTLGRRVFIVEVGDAVEDDRLGRVIGKTLCSDFVLPAYFDPSLPAPYDWLGHLLGPCPAMCPGGYLAFLEGNQWHQIMARLEDNTFSYRALRNGRCAAAASRPIA
jgi:hypothetical protein